MNKSLKYFGIALLTIILLLLIIPALLPLENYKGKITDEVKKATGRDLVIAGKISLSFIPVPTVKLHNIKLSSVPQAQNPSLFKVKVITATLAPLKLLTGKIAISFIKLEEPEINLETLAAGTDNWEFLQTTSHNNLTQTNKYSASTFYTLPFEIQRVAIKQGKIQYIKKNEKTFIVKNIDIDSHIKTLKGPIEFDLSFNFLSQAFNLKGKIQEIGDTIPLTAALKVLGHDLNIDGLVKLQTFSFAGNITLQGNLKNFITLAPDIKIPEGLKQNYKFATYIVADEEKVNITPIDFALGELQASGIGNYYIKKNKGSLRLNLNPGDIKISITPEKNQQGEWLASLYMQTQTIKPLVDAIKTDSTTILPTFLNQEFSLSTDGSYQDQNLFLKNIKFALGNAINLKGMVGVKNLNQETPLILYDLSTDNGSALLSLSGMELPFTITNLLIKGAAKKSKDNFSINTYINTAKFNTHIQGDIKVNKAMISSIKVTSSGDSLGQTLQSLFKTPANQKLGAFLISANLQADKAKTLKLSLDKSSFAVGNNTTILDAKGALTLNGNKPKITLNLEVSSINLDDWLSTSSALLTSQKGADNNYQSINKTPWSKNKIDLSALSVFDGDLTISLQKLIQGSLVFDNIKAKMLLQNGVLELNPLTGNLYGGHLNGTAHLSAQGQQALKLSATLKGAELKNIISKHKEIKITQGKLNLSTNLKSEGKTQYQYVNNLSGNINFDAFNGHLSGLNLQKTIDALTNIKRIEDVHGLIDNSFSGGKTVFKSILGNLIIDKGIATLHQFKLDSGKLTANAKGTINIPKYWMDIVSTINVDINNMPPFNVSLYGMLNNPQHKLDTKFLSQYIVQNILTRIIDGVTNGKSRPEDIIKGVIGLGNKNKASATNNSQQPLENNSDTQEKESNPADILIKKGLKELFK